MNFIRPMKLMRLSTLVGVSSRMEPSKSVQTVKTRILIISDTHSRKPFDSSDRQYAFRSPLPEADILLHAGDLTESGKEWEYQTQREMLMEHSAELKIVIPGNHDITLDEPYYASHKWHHSWPENLADIRQMWTGSEASKAGIVMMMKEGIRSFELKNGAMFTLYASPYQPEFCDWAFGYPRTQDRFNPSSPAQNLPGRGAANPVPSHPGVDIMLTHGPPFGILDKVRGSSGRMDSSVGCVHLLRAVKRAAPRLHVFGHIHEGYGKRLVNWRQFQDSESQDELDSGKIDMADVLEKGHAFIDISASGSHTLEWGQETLFINASIMDGSYKPRNAPWVVELELPLKV